MRVKRNYHRYNDDAITGIAIGLIIVLVAFWVPLIIWLSRG